MKILLFPLLCMLWAFLPTTVQAQNSQLVQPRKVKGSARFAEMPAKQIVDGDLSTLWGPKYRKGTDHPAAGLGEFLVFKWKEPHVFTQLLVYNGAGSDFAFFSKNNRPSQIRLSFDGEREVVFPLPDQNEAITLKIPEIEAREVRLEIVEKIVGTGPDVAQYTYTMREVEWYALDPLIVALKKAVSSDSSALATSVVQDFKEEGRDLNQVMVNGVPLLEYVLKKGAMDVSKVLLEEDLELRKANIPGLNGLEPKSEYMEYSQKIRGIQEELRADLDLLAKVDLISMAEVEAYRTKLKGQYAQLLAEDRNLLKEEIDAHLAIILNESGLLDLAAKIREPGSIEDISFINEKLNQVELALEGYLQMEAIAVIINKVKGYKEQIIVKNLKAISNKVLSYDSAEEALEYKAFLLAHIEDSKTARVLDELFVKLVEDIERD